MDNTLYVGLDVGADEIQACVMAANGQMIGERLLPHCAETLHGFLMTTAPDRRLALAMEAASPSIKLTRVLRSKGYDVTVLHSYHVSKFLKVRQNKSDRNDARGIADLLRMGGQGISRVHVKSPSGQAIKSQLVIRQNLVVQRVAMDNVLRSVLRLNGVSFKRWRSPDRMQIHVRSEITRLRDDGTHLPENLEALLDLCLAMRRYLDVMTKTLEDLANSIDVCARWMEIPGVGPMTALSMYSAIDDPDRFKRIGDLAPYLGLVPSIAQSGPVMRRLGISKRGDRMTRTYLVSAAMIMMMRPRETRLKQWALSLQDRVGRGRARTALARKLATTMLAMWKNGQAFEPFRNGGAPMK